MKPIPEIQLGRTQAREVTVGALLGSMGAAILLAFAWPFLVALFS
jgi:hypothetical protein